MCIRSIDAAAFRRASAPAMLFALLSIGPACAQGYPSKFDFGQPATEQEIAAFAIAIPADGKGLPAGKGDYALYRIPGMVVMQFSYDGPASNPHRLENHRPRSVVYVGTHQSFPLHDPPWDFWRFSDEAWKCLFNRATGFEVVTAALGEPAEMIALSSHPAVWRIEQQRAFFTSNALMRKTGEATVDWPVAMSDLDVGDYPA